MLVLAACSRQATITYRVKNLSSDSVIIVRSYTGNPTLSDTAWLGYNQEAIIGVAGKGKNHVSTYRSEAALFFSSVEVYKIGFAARSAAGFTDFSRWRYAEQSSHAADFSTVITDADFR